MNAAIFTKSAKGLILASGLIAASSVISYAQDAAVPLGAQATVALSSLYQSAPTGITTLGGHSFDFTGGNLIQLANGQSASFSGSWTNAQAAYLLLNTYNTYLWYDQTPVGTVTITFADGTTATTTLTVGSNVREWRIGAGFTDNMLTDPAAAQVWSGTAYDGTAATIDMLTITLPGTKTVTGVSVANTNSWGSLGINLAGLTLDPQNPQPQAPQCIRPGNSCNTPAAQNSHAKKWQPTTTTTPAATDSLSSSTDSDSNGHGHGHGHGHKSQ